MCLIYWATLQRAYLDLYDDFRWLGKTHFHALPCKKDICFSVTHLAKHFTFRMLLTPITLEKWMEPKWLWNYWGKARGVCSVYILWEFSWSSKFSWSSLICKPPWHNSIDSAIPEQFLTSRQKHITNLAQFTIICQTRISHPVLQPHTQVSSVHRSCPPGFCPPFHWFTKPHFIGKDNTQDIL